MVILAGRAPAEEAVPVQLRQLAAVEGARPEVVHALVAVGQRSASRVALEEVVGPPRGGRSTVAERLDRRDNRGERSGNAPP